MDTKELAEEIKKFTEDSLQICYGQYTDKVNKLAQAYLSLHEKLETANKWDEIDHHEFSKLREKYDALLEEHASVKEQLSLCNYALDSADANINTRIGKDNEDK